VISPKKTNLFLNAAFAQLADTSIIHPVSKNPNERSSTVDPQVLITVGAIAVLLVLMVLPQWQARRRRQKQMAEMGVGSEVMTIGGIIGKITYLDKEENRARIEIAPGVEIQVVLNAVSQPLESPADEMPADETSEEE
jgi:preprotein translocase subunit YajC